MRCHMTAWILGWVAHTSLALGPHELLVLANRNSTNSMDIARQYAALRSVPEINIVALDLPATLEIEVSAEIFAQKIWVPAQAAIRERGLDDHILAWAYSVDFPLRIKTDPPVSIQGLTFLRNQFPGSEPVSKGLYVSPLFAGPENPRSGGFPAQSLDIPRAWFGKHMPVPSMMLGFIGPNGNTRDEVLACLQRGAQADGTRPAGTVYFVTNTDVRSRCREWEFAPAVRELQARGLTAILTNALPDNAPDILGAMLGTSVVGMHPGRTFRPGAMAEHLTSFGALFDNSNQTKISEWIRAGASASAGTVTEPYAYWNKFPHARFYAHWASGCTTLESFFQAIRCPLQILLVGDPLTSPWAPASTLSLRGLESETLQGLVTVEATVEARQGETFNRFLFLVDGKRLQPMGKSSTISLDTTTLKPGRHTLHAVATSIGSVRTQIFTVKPFVVKRAL
jgi:uncharacterized protein (TIGR03790 family)